VSPKQSGMVLVQVLGIVALASSIAVTMLVLQEGAARQTLATRDRLQAETLAIAGETSVKVAFRRDGETHPLTDHYGEAWYTASQAPIEIREGRFAVTLRDAQAKFNLNRLAAGASDRVLFNRIASVAGLAPETGDRIAAQLASGIELSALSDLVALGFTAEEIDTLAPWVTVLPRPAELNLNTADPALVRAVLGNPAAASQFLARREFTEGPDLSGNNGTGVLLPPGTGLVTSYLEVEIAVQSGEASVRLRSQIARRSEPGGIEVYTVTRSWK
jgi:general secretion pathway protein K